MTIYKNVGWDENLAERFGNDVYIFLCKDAKLIEYLSDHIRLWASKDLVAQLQLSDNSVFVLPICKFFEGVLYLMAKEMLLFALFNNGQEPESIRGFFKSNRKNIEDYIDQQASYNSDKQAIKDKLFSTVEDFKERHSAVHFGSLLNGGEIDNYEAVITKIRDTIRILFDSNLLKK